ncbi:hypothetical protein RCZ15_24690 [Capnocytophaga catalasegens]|uniref:Lipoprotein n=2 Tax=Capnocytophaga catalasegens TaxID=1004260 RepID=A0AAV5AZJ4_9FLAO|nr:hypothetical protein [Capnocytophaga catalasegens]GIZ14376.1 hypothetical protein RCZ03_03770 [Capnocytophaga catalasegens]GJM51496.1 hypothetical protein RCZ15_24690 [Capnocytophaga catalasegens]GJM53400.1 hypothetical protein RCZ16_17170 [Capnocytophaga catalasegens]
MLMDIKLKNVLLIFSISIVLVSCEKFAQMFIGKEPMVLFNPNKSLFIQNEKSSYKVGDTLRIVCKFPTKLFRSKEKMSNYEIDVHQDEEIKPYLKNLFTIKVWNVAPIGITLFKDNKPIIEYIETLQYVPVEDMYVSSPITILLLDGVKRGEEIYLRNYLFIDGEETIVRTNVPWGSIRLRIFDELKIKIED